MNHALSQFLLLPSHPLIESPFLYSSFFIPAYCVGVFLIAAEEPGISIVPFCPVCRSLNSPYRNLQDAAVLLWSCACPLGTHPWNLGPLLSCLFTKVPVLHGSLVLSQVPFMPISSGGTCISFTKISYIARVNRRHTLRETSPVLYSHRYILGFTPNYQVSLESFSHLRDSSIILSLLWSLPNVQAPWTPKWLLLFPCGKNLYLYYTSYISCLLSFLCCVLQQNY